MKPLFVWLWCRVWAHDYRRSPVCGDDDYWCKRCGKVAHLRGADRRGQCEQ